MTQDFKKYHLEFTAYDQVLVHENIFDRNNGRLSSTLMTVLLHLWCLNRGIDVNYFPTLPLLYDIYVRVYVKIGSRVTDSNDIFMTWIIKCNRNKVISTISVNSDFAFTVMYSHMHCLYSIASAM